MKFKSEAFVDDLICSQFSLATLTEVEFGDCYSSSAANKEISGLVIGERVFWKTSFYAAVIVEWHGYMGGDGQLGFVCFLSGIAGGSWP